MAWEVTQRPPTLDIDAVFKVTIRWNSFNLNLKYYSLNIHLDLYVKAAKWGKDRSAQTQKANMIISDCIDTMTHNE